MRAKRYYLYVFFLQLVAALGLAGCRGGSGGVVLPEGRSGAVLSDVVGGQIDVGVFSGSTEEAAPWAELVRGRLVERLVGGERGGEAGEAGEERLVVSGQVSLSRAGGGVVGCGSRVRAEVVFELREGPGGVLVERVLLGRWAEGSGAEGIWYSLSGMVEAYCERIRGGSRRSEVVFAEGRSEDDRLGRRAAALGEWAKARGLFRRAVDAHPDDDAALYNSGLVCEAQGEYEQALAYYDRALGVMPRALYAGARNRARQK